MTIREGLHYNPYFPGGAIAMAQALFDDMITYEDGPSRGRIVSHRAPSSALSGCPGTPATQSQMAKDVATFLTWCAEPEHDERKRMGLKAMVMLSLATIVALYAKRFRWSVLKSRKLVYTGPRTP